MRISIQNTYKLLAFQGFLFLLLVSEGCNKLVESPPPSESISESNVYSIDATSISALNGIYISMNANSQPFQGTLSISLLAGLSADELVLYSGFSSGVLYRYYTNSLSQALGTNYSGAEHWSVVYNYIFRCNAAIEGLKASSSLSPGVKQQLLGEAKFLRAFYYFYLVNLFGDLPLVVTTDPEINTWLGRSSKNEVYLQIISDLQEAEELLSANFLNESLSDISVERVRPTRWAAKALLARAYLYTGDWKSAEAKASEVISNTTLFNLVPLNLVFLKNSKEAIWQLQPTAINFNTQEAQTLVIPQAGPNGVNNPVYLSKNLLNSFEVGDQRAVLGNWIDTTIYKITSTQNDTVRYANKYKANTLDANISSSTGALNMKEYFMMLRLGEQYLIRAEARIQLGDLNGGKEDLNTIRKRAFSPESPVTSNDKAILSTAILHERQVELFTEWGHRWLDLKRTHKVDEVMMNITPIKSNGNVSWQTFQQLYPLPLVSDLQKAPNLVQNEGY